MWGERKVVLRELFCCTFVFSRLRHALAIVVKKTRDSADHGDLENNLKGIWFITTPWCNDGEVLKLMVKFAEQSKLLKVLEFLKRTGVAWGLSGGRKVDKEITIKESNDAWMVPIHLESVRLKKKQMTSGVQLDVAMVSNMVEGFMFTIVQTEKKTFLKSMVEQLLSINEMVTLLLVDLRPFENRPT